MSALSIRLVAASGFVLVWLLTGSLGSSAIAAGHAVSIVDGAFTPRRLTIKLSDSVAWTNRGSEVHSVFFDAFNSNDLRSGASYSHKFTKAGSFTYVCAIHGFNGTVVVMGPASTPKPTPKPTAKPTPKPTPKPTAKPTPKSTATAAPAAATPSATAMPTIAAAVASPSPSFVTAASTPVGSPSSAGAPVTPDPGGTSSSSLPLILLGVLVAGGVLVGVRLNRGRR